MRCLSLQPGQRVLHGENPYVIQRFGDLTSVIAREEVSGVPKVLRISELRLPAEPTPPTQVELGLVTDKRWREAQQRMDIIAPLLESCDTGRQAIAARAIETGVGQSSIWRWLRNYNNSGGFMGLLCPEAHTTLGRSLLLPEVDAIIQSCIELHYLSAKQWSVVATYDEIKRLCRNAKLPVPGYGTVNRRVNAIPEITRLKRRGKSKKARDKFEPRPGHYTEGQYPLDVIQIDHTQLDIVVVDEVERLSIGRPWLTLGIDICTRCVWGMKLGATNPDARITGLCITHGALGKEKYLSDLGVNGEWPIWGIPRVIHVDNGRDFRGLVLARGCQKWGMTLQFRPAYRPNYGAHIERYFGTLESELHKLPGTTFSSPEARGEYDSDAKASLTLRELEVYIVRFIIDIYHKRPHSGLNGESPLQVYERMLLTG